MTLAEQLVARCQRPVPEAALEQARRHVLDWVGCVLGAAREPLAKQLRSALAKKRGSTPSFGAGRLEPEAAKTYATALGNLLEMDDLARAALLHPGPVVVPVAVYAGLEQGVSWKDTLLGIVRGYEAAARLGVLLDGFHYARWHPTTTVGMAAAAVTASSLRSLTALQTLAALANGLSVSGGLWHMRHHDVATKQWHLVHAGRSGAHAAEMAELGFTGSPEILEGPQGWLEVLSQSPPPNSMFSGEEWSIHSVSFKPWPACRHCHAAIDAALALHSDVAVAELGGVVVETYADAMTFCNQPEPRTPGEGRFSLQHCVSVALLQGDVKAADFAESRLTDPQVVALRRRVRVSVQPSFTRAYPGHFGSAVKVTDGTGRETTVSIADAKGDPEWPLMDHDLLKKYHDLAEWGVGNLPEVSELANAILQAPLDTPLSEIFVTAP